MIRDSLIVFVARIAASLAVLGVGIAAARSLGPEGRGQLAVVVTTVLLLQLFANLGLTLSNVYHLGRGTVGVADAIAVSIYVGLAASLVLAGVALVLIPVLGSVIYEGVPTGILVLGLANLPPMVVGGHLNAINLARGRILAYNLIYLCQGIVNLALVVLFLYGLGLGLASLMVAWLAATTTTAAAALATNLAGAEWRTALSPTVARRSARVLLSYGVRGQVGNVAQFMSNRFDQILVSAWLGTTPLGFYAAAVTIGEAFRFLPDAISTVLFSRVSAASDADALRLTRRAFRLTLAFAVVWTTGLLVVSRPMVELLYGSAFEPAVTASRILVVGVGLLMSSSVLGAYLAGRGRVIVNSWITMAGLVVTLALDIVLIPRWGIEGAATASLVSYSVSAVLTTIFYRRAVTSIEADAVLVDPTPLGLRPAGDRAS